MLSLFALFLLDLLCLNRLLGSDVTGFRLCFLTFICCAPVLVQVAVFSERLSGQHKIPTLAACVRKEEEDYFAWMLFLGRLFS